MRRLSSLDTPHYIGANVHYMGTSATPDAPKWRSEEFRMGWDDGVEMALETLGACQALALALAIAYYPKMMANLWRDLQSTFVLLEGKGMKA